MSLKSKSSLTDNPGNKASLATPRVAKLSKGVTKSDADSPSPSPTQNTRVSVDRSPRSVTSKPTVDRRSPRVSTPPEKPQSRILKPSELQAQLAAAQEDLKKAKEKLVLAEKEKVQTTNELKEVKKLADEANEKLQEALVAQKRAEESSEIEKFRAIEMEQAGIEAAQKKEEEWHKEMELIRNQQAEDAAALLSATQELKRVEQELVMTIDAKNQALNHADDATKIAEIHAQKVDGLSAELGRLRGLLDSKLENENKSMEEMKLELDYMKEELEKAKSFEDMVHEKEEAYEQLHVELEASRMAESYAKNLLEEWRTHVEELELQVEQTKRLERSASESLGSVMKQLEGNSDILHEAECEISSLKEKVSLLEISIGRQKVDLEESDHLLEEANQEAAKMDSIIKSLESEVETLKEEKAQALENEKLAASSVQGLLEEKNKLINEMETLKEEEEKSKKAMESLASALHEVSAESRQAKEMLLSSQADHESFEAQMEDLKLLLKATSEKYEALLDDAKREIDHLTSSTEQSKQEFENQIEDLRLVLKATNEKYESLLNDAKHEIDHLRSKMEESDTEYQNSRVEWEKKELQLVSCVKTSEEEKLVWKATMEKYENMVEDAKQEIDQLTNNLEQSKIEHESSKAEWEQKELQLLNCVKGSEVEKSSMEKEVMRLVNLLRETEEKAYSAEEEGSQLRTSLVEARSEATSLKEALEEAQAESIKLKNSLSDKENELQNILQVNQQLRSAEDANVRKVEELSKLLEEAKVKKQQIEENGELSDSEKDYDLLPKVVEFSEENGHKSEDKPKMDHLRVQAKDPEKTVVSEMNIVLTEESTPRSEVVNGRAKTKTKTVENEDKLMDETVASESKMWESCKIEERDYSPEREGEQESLDDDAESKADAGDSFDPTNPLPRENSNSEISPLKQEQHQKKKKPLYRKFGSLLKKGIGNQK